jgi:hypothetical protein
MQKAYVTFATTVSPTKDGSNAVERSRWADLVSEAANHHARLIGEMKQGKFEDWKADPRSTA